MRVRVEEREGLPREAAFRRLLKDFRWRVEKAGILTDARKAAVFEKPSEKRHKKARARRVCE